MYWYPNKDADLSLLVMLVGCVKSLNYDGYVAVSWKDVLEAMKKLKLFDMLSILVHLRVN